eukprot:gene9495-10487_t
MPCFEGICLEPGSLLSSSFKDLKVIGRSCNGFVYSAVDRVGGLHKKVALKKLPLKRKSHCRVALRELRIQKRLDHENIVKNIDIRTPDGREVGEASSESLRNVDFVYLVEELLDTDLHNVLDRTGKLPEKVSKLFLYQLLRGLKYIHSANVVHRDIKPGNLFLNTDDLSLKIGDFGLSRIVDQKYEHSGHLTELVTTRYYRAPEVMLTQGDYNSSLDIWSSGCVFAEMCTGTVLFPGENDLEQIDCIKTWFQADGNTSGRFQTTKLTGISQAGLDFLQKMLRLDPSKRPSAAQLLEDPYFGDIHDPADEPVCPSTRVFHIEDEVDDLPIQTLRNVIANECLSDSRHFSPELFGDFDDDFDCDESYGQQEPKSMLRNDGGEFYLSCCESDQSNNHIDDYSETTSATTSDIDTCPSLANIIDSSIEDEPYRDPGCSKASFGCYEYGDIKEEKLSPITTDHCSSNFPKATTMLDLSNVAAAPVDRRKSFEQTFPMMPFQTIPRSMLQTKTIEKEFQNMKKLNMTGLESRRTCRASDYAVFEHLRRNKFHGNFHHWDPIRIWI